MGIRYADFAEGLKEEGMDLLSEHRDELTPQFAELLESVQGMSAVEYKRDDMARTEVFDAVQDVFDAYDLLVTPTLAVGPTKVTGEEVDPLLGWCLTYPINFTGHPAASVPAGFIDEGLPVGMQIIGRRYADDVVLAASAAFERIRPWHDSYPPR